MMNMELQRMALGGFHPAYQTLLRQEETMESIVPDALPDIAQIVDSSGTAFFRQKETVDGSIRVTGSVRAAVLYLPEGGGEPCCMTVNIPFLCNGDHPVIRSDSSARVHVAVISADARALNPRKVLVRVEVSVGVQIYCEEKAEITECVQSPEELQLQTLTEKFKNYSVTHVLEKNISFSDVLSLSGVRPSVKSLLSHRAEITSAEAKAIGKRVVVKGSAVLYVLYLCDGGVASAHFDLPFSQIIDAGGIGEECEVTSDTMLTGLHCEEKGEGGIEVTIEAMVQAVVHQEREVSMVSDLYSTQKPLEVTWERIRLDQLLEQGAQRQMIHQFCPIETPVKQIVECRAVTGETNLIPDGESSNMLTAKIYVSILFLDEEGTPRSAAFALSANCGIPAFEGAKCGSRCALTGENLATPVSGGVEVRLEAVFSYLYTRQLEANSVSAVLPGKKEEPAEPLPSLKIRSVEAGDRLWDIAKCCSSTVADIRAANELVGDELKKGMLLLVPRHR